MLMLYLIMSQREESQKKRTEKRVEQWKWQIMIPLLFFW